MVRLVGCIGMDRTNVAMDRTNVGMDRLFGSDMLHLLLRQIRTVSLFFLAYFLALFIISGKSWGFFTTGP